jgi:uncharacterized protein
MRRREVITGLVGCLAGPAFAAKPNAALDLVRAARAQIGQTTIYDPAYVVLPFPNGDVPVERGVCTDVVIRAYRQALSIDLQKLVNADMRANFSAYPKTWGLKRADRNIDHRRVPNLQTFFKRRNAELRLPAELGRYAPGDIVSMMLPGNLPHIGIVSDEKNAAGDRQLFIHNIGGGAASEDVLGTYRITGRYRFMVG